MQNRVLNYIPRDSFIHRLSGTTKFIIFLSFSFLCGLSFDTRVLLVLLALSIIGFILSKIKLKENQAGPVQTEQVSHIKETGLHPKKKRILSKLCFCE